MLDHRLTRGRWRAAVLVPVLALLSAAALTACDPGVDCNGETYYPGADLSGTDQSGKDLGLCVLTGIDFSGANFSGTLLANADLSGSDLSGATFDGADLRNARLSGTDVEGTALGSAANLLVFSGGMTGTPASLPVDWSLRGGWLVGPGVNLVGTDLSGVDLSSTNLTNAFLIDTVLNGTQLSYVTLTNAYLQGAAMGGSLLDHVTSGGIVGTPTDLPPGWTLEAGTLIGPADDDATGQVVCEAGESCNVGPVEAPGVKATASFGPGNSNVTLVVEINPDDAPPFSCDTYAQNGKPIIEFYFTGGDASTRVGTLTATYTDVPSEPNLDDYQVCWAAPYPFVAKSGSFLGVAEVQGTKPGTTEPLYVGVLPDCDLGSGYFLAPPCVSERTWDYYEGVILTVSTTGADPWRY